MLGIEIDRQGRGRCPVHGGDGESSFSVRESDSGGILWHCFACGAGGGWKKLYAALGMGDEAGSITTKRKPRRSGPKDYEVRKEVRRQYREILADWTAAWTISEGDDLAIKYGARDSAIARASDWFDEPLFATRIEFLDAVAAGMVALSGVAEYEFNLLRPDTHPLGKPIFDPIPQLARVPCRAARLLAKRLREHGAVFGDLDDPEVLVKYAAFSLNEAEKGGSENGTIEWLQIRAAVAAGRLRYRLPDLEGLPVGRDRRYPRCVLAWIEASSGGDGDRTG